MTLAELVLVEWSAIAFGVVFTLFLVGHIADQF